MPSSAPIDTNSSAISHAAAVMPLPIPNPAKSPAMVTASPAVFKPKDVANPGKNLDKGLDRLAPQWGNRPLKPDVEPDGQPSLTGSGCGLEAPPEFFLLGIVRAVEDFNPRAIEKAMLGAWMPRKVMGMTVVDENLYLFCFTYRLDVNRVLQEGSWRFQEYVLALKEVPRGFAVPKESLVMVPFWIQLFGVPAMWQRVEVPDCGDENSSHEDDSTELN